MPEPLTRAQIAPRLGGRVAGAQEVLIHQAASPGRAGPGRISFLSTPIVGGQLTGTGAARILGHLKARELLERVRSLERQIKDKEKGNG